MLFDQFTLSSQHFLSGCQQRSMGFIQRLWTDLLCTLTSVCHHDSYGRNFFQKFRLLGWKSGCGVRVKVFKGQTWEGEGELLGFTDLQICSFRIIEKVWGTQEGDELSELFFHWSKVPMKPAQIRIMCAMPMCKLCIYTRSAASAVNTGQGGECQSHGAVNSWLFLTQIIHTITKCYIAEAWLQNLKIMFEFMYKLI